MGKRLMIGAVVAFAVIFNLGYLFHEIVAAGLFREGLGPGVQRAHYLIPVIAASFAVYVAMMALLYPLFSAWFVEKRGWSPVATGALLGLYCGFLWDALQGGLIEYATYNVSLSLMLADSAYHTVEGALAGSILGAFQRGVSVSKV